MTKIKVFVPQELFDKLNKKDQEKLKKLLSGNTGKEDDPYMGHEEIVYTDMELYSVKANKYDRGLSETARAIYNISEVLQREEEMKELRAKLEESQKLVKSVQEIKKYFKE